MATPPKDTKSSSPAAAQKAVGKKVTAKAMPGVHPSSAKATEGREVQKFDMSGKGLGTIVLPKEIFGASWRPDLVHQVTTAIQANMRQNRAHTKDRSEVSGGGKKPWKQKGTGQARHGSRRSPIWRHGGVALGPRNVRDYSEKVNKKMRYAALVSVLSKKAAEGEVLFVDALTFGAPKTAEAKRFLGALAQGAKAEGLIEKHKNAALVAFTDYDSNKIKSFRNIDNLATEEVRNLNALNVLTHKYLVIESPEAAFSALAPAPKTQSRSKK
jgi:large subunit ribosomal protein L4